MFDHLSTVGNMYLRLIRVKKPCVAKLGSRLRSVIITSQVNWAKLHKVNGFFAGRNRDKVLQDWYDFGNHGGY